MGDRDTRQYNGVYTAKDGKKHKIKVSVNSKRLAAFGLSLSLVIAAGFKLIDATSENMPSLEVESTTSFEEESKKLIEKIIAEKKDILKEIVIETYAVKDGDTLSEIGKKFGCDVKRLGDLNGLGEGDKPAPGTPLNVETKKDKTGLDRTLAALESYFYDYVFNSPVAQIAKSPESEGSLYRLILFGEPKSPANLDPNSIYGSYIGSYLSFHGLENQTEEAKRAYVDSLLMLARDTSRSLNIGGSSTVIIPFERYSDYLRSGTTKNDDIKVQVIGQTI